MKQVIIFLFVFCTAQSFAQKNQPLKLSLDQNTQHQGIKGFGASDSWRVRFVGENWPVNKRNKIADLLFSLDLNENGSPKGIGLSSWRFYVGAGSAEQGDASDIRNVWRRSPCFLDSLGNYDWRKYKGQRWFLQAAKKRGVSDFQIYSISPPVFYTKNGLAHATKGDLNFNLQDDKYDDYANFMVDIVDHFKREEGIDFKYISPFNEPQWAWDKSNQEGTPATNQQLYRYLTNLSESLHERGLETKMIVGEAGSLNYLYEPAGNNDNGDQINVFFNPASPLYIGALKNMEYCITGHSYFTTWPLAKQISTRKKLAERINEINPRLDFWQSEFCILEKNDETTGGWNRDLGMATALYVARVIHSDLCIANAKSWDWWTALSQFNYKDGLIHLDDGIGAGVSRDNSKLNHDLISDGCITETKLLWAMGNFSRFVRPGMIRIQVNREDGSSLLDQAGNMQVSAFKDNATGRVVLVFINHNKKHRKIKPDFGRVESAEMFITDEKRNLEKCSVNLADLVIPGRSVATLVLAY